MVSGYDWRENYFCKVCVGVSEEEVHMAEFKYGQEGGPLQIFISEMRDKDKCCHQSSISHFNWDYFEYFYQSQNSRSHFS